MANRPPREALIELFIRPQAETGFGVTGYALMQVAEKNNWVASRRLLRPGLEQWSMKSVAMNDGYRIDHLDYFIATDIAGFDGLPPVAGCTVEGASLGGGGATFAWGDQTRVGVRMDSGLCRDWPEIWREIVRVLQLIKKA